MALDNQYKLWSQYAAVLDDFIRYHRENIKLNNTKQSRKRRKEASTVTEITTAAKCLDPITNYCLAHDKEGVQSSHEQMVCYNWVRDKALSYGDHMPDALSVDVLPVYTKRELYLWFTSDKESKADLVSYQRFVCNLFDNRIMKATVTLLLYFSS